MSYSEYRNRGKATRYEADEKPFLAFDGEGRTLEGKHKYVLLACSNGRHVYNPSGLSTSECLNFLLSSQRSKCIRIFYSFGYDVQQMLVDLPDDLLVQIMHGQMVRFGPYRLSYMPGKIFVVNNIRFYDVFNFWQKSFIKAVTESLGPNSVSENLVHGKQSRSDFATWDVADILRYTNEELQLLVSLAEHLRTILLKSDIHLGSSFYGPGSIANYWFKRHQIAPPPIVDPKIIDVMERAYYGGRFETFKLGRVENIYECDINSAYPAVLSSLPYLDEWTSCPGRGYFSPTISPYSVWHVEWHLGVSETIGPFPSRDKHGLISYPANGIGWYWKCEVEAAIALYGKGCFKIRSGYYPNVTRDQPFDWINDVYLQRRELKSNNDPAERGLKIGLNSLYGKTAQRVGTAKYFSLAWAGYITSSTRAKLLQAANIVGTEHVAAFATDACYFDTAPEGLDFGKGLGQFGREPWDRAFFIQSGVYRLERKPLGSDRGRVLNDGLIRKDAYRGYHVEKGIQDVFDQIQAHPFTPPFIYTTKFIGHLEAIKCPVALGPHRLCFILIRKKIQPFKTTKRKVLDPEVWNIFEDGGWIEPGYVGGRVDKEVRTAIREFDRTPGGNLVYNSYALLLSRSVLSTILENHNDHSNFINRDDTGVLEESYPFARISKREDDLALSSNDDIAVERIGGALGILPSRFRNNLPVVDEDEIAKELENG